MKALGLLDRLTGYASNSLAFIGAVGMVLMVLHVIIDVTGRFVFNHPLTGTLETVTYYYMVMVTVLPFAYVTRRQGQIVVELFTGWMPARWLAGKLGEIIGVTLHADADFIGFCRNARAIDEVGCARYAGVTQHTGQRRGDQSGTKSLFDQIFLPGEDGRCAIFSVSACRYRRLRRFMPVVQPKQPAIGEGRGAAARAKAARRSMRSCGPSMRLGRCRLRSRRHIRAARARVARAR